MVKDKNGIMYQVIERPDGTFKYLKIPGQK